MGIQENLRAVQVRLSEAARQCGRDPAQVQLIAVSKTRPVSEILEAFQAGQLDFGENYAQELRDKATEISQPLLRWHFIGSLQRNKVKYVVGRACWIHDVDHVELAGEIGKRSGTPTSILLGVNIGKEPQKSGVLPEMLWETIENVQKIQGISLRGLMCIPPASQDPEGAAPFFEEMAFLASEGRKKGIPLTELSMGMSHDYPVAVRYGATMIRVGTAIFGARIIKTQGDDN